VTAGRDVEGGTDGAAEGDVEGDVERLTADHPPAIRAIESSLRAVLHDEAPGTQERVDFGNRLIAVGWSMAMRDLLFAIIAHREHVNLQLADGAALPDPDGLVEGTGKRIRHVKIRSTEAATSPAVRALIRAQLAARPRIHQA
jgi:hypothetical protein